MSAIHPYSRYFVVTVTEALEEEFDGYSEKFLYIHIIVFVDMKSCFDVLFAAVALIRNSGSCVGRFGEDMLLLSRIHHIDHTLYKPARNLF